MPEPHYKLLPRGVPIPLSELEGSKHCTFAVPEPEHPDIPEGKWYCENGACIVRECVICCKAYGERLPEMWCPVCGETLKFLHWIGRETLVPVREG
jgi:hypothetical protein